MPKNFSMRFMSLSVPAVNLAARRELLDRGLEMRLRAEVRSNMLYDRSWQRRREVEARALARAHDQLNRIKLRQPLLRRRHFRDI